jgi:hypothetical protein
MTKSRFGAAALGLSFAAMSASFAFAQSTQAELDAELINSLSTEGVVSSEASCAYEGGDVLDLEAGKVCFIAVRGEEFNTKAYDNQKLGVIKCAGNGAFSNELVQPSGQFCRVFLEQKKVAPSREEVEAATRAAVKAEDALN